MNCEKYLKLDNGIDTCHTNYCTAEHLRDVTCPIKYKMAKQRWAINHNGDTTRTQEIVHVGKQMTMFKKV